MREFERKMKERIEKELAEVNRRVVALKKEPRSTELETFGDTTPLTEEIEAIQVGEEREMMTAVLSKLLDRANALDEARHRIDQGLYGICVSCQRRIERKRLLAVPEASLCVDCQKRAEARRKVAEPRRAEWLSAEEYYGEREKFNEAGFEKHQPRPQEEEAAVWKRRRRAGRPAGP
jgi:DnaK suppressor protein